MKLFKIDEYKLYEKYFENMKVSEFFALDHIPENVEPEHMRNMADFLKAEKKYFSDNKLGAGHTINQEKYEEEMSEANTGYSATDDMLRDDAEEEYQEAEESYEGSDEEEFENMTISQVVIRKMIEDGEIDMDDMLESLDK